uniref:Ectonucleoside triphosphate diphosphohydrolase 8 n=1 Tax=Crocodylus porosus TaxID=8502 RepID=A0A7M4EZQ4_CROPO
PAQPTRESLQVRPKYAMVFDAGSSHTTLYIYQWPADKENDTGIVSQVEACPVPGPGISSYFNRPSDAGASLKVCLDKAMTLIPANQQRETPAYLGATAGMRLLRYPHHSDQVLAEVSKAIREYPVDFQGARILTGNEEGSFGWITVNYLLETLIKVCGVGRVWRNNEVLGALDLGGASTQITFQPSGTIEDNSTKVFFRLYGTEYSIYTHSYLCYGRDQALKMLLASLSKTHPWGWVFCFDHGERQPLFLLQSLPYQLVPPSHLSWGTQEAVNIVLLFSLQFPNMHRIQVTVGLSCGKMCGFNEVYQPPVHGQFFAFSGFYYTFNFLNLTSSQSFSTLGSSLLAVHALSCWLFQLKASYPREKEVRLSNYCASAFYILTLLHEGYGFNEQTWSNIHFRQQAGNTDIGWTLGYVLNLSNMIPTEAPEQVTGHWHSLWAAAVAFIVLTLIVSLVAITLQFLWSPK